MLKITLRYDKISGLSVCGASDISRVNLCWIIREVTMLRSRFHYIAAFTIIICLLIPALIQGTKQGADVNRHNPFIKLPPVITIGPESSPYVLTQREQDKLRLVIDDITLPLQPVHKDYATIADTGEHSGLTEAELKKLSQVHRIKITPRSISKNEPISTIQVVPREPGAAGLTKAEKAKLDAWKKSRANTPQTGHNQ
jgi:hypothetical protein